MFNLGSLVQGFESTVFHLVASGLLFLFNCIAWFSGFGFGLKDTCFWVSAPVRQVASFPDLQWFYANDHSFGISWFFVPGCQQAEP